MAENTIPSVKKRYSHTYDVFFKIESDYPAHEVPVSEILAGLEKRLRDLTAGGKQLVDEAICSPF